MPRAGELPGGGRAQAGRGDAARNVSAGGRRHLPLLVTQNYGRGRTAVFATGGSWRWQMLQPLADKTHEMFWQQLLRWLVADTPGQRDGVDAAARCCPTKRRVPLRAEVRDKSFQPAVQRHGGSAHRGPGRHRGQRRADARCRSKKASTRPTGRADKPGSYMAEVVVRQGQRGSWAATW